MDEDLSKVLIDLMTKFNRPSSEVEQPIKM